MRLNADLSRTVAYHQALRPLSRSSDQLLHDAKRLANPTEECSFPFLVDLGPVFKFKPMDEPLPSPLQVVIMRMPKGIYPTLKAMKT